MHPEGSTTTEYSRYAATQAPEPGQRQAIPQELDAVAKQTDELSELIRQLGQRLQPVLAPMPPVAENRGPATNESRSPIADMLHAHRMELSRQATELRTVLNALAL